VRNSRLTVQVRIEAESRFCIRHGSVRAADARHAGLRPGPESATVKLVTSEDIAPYLPAEEAGADGDYLVWFRSPSTALVEAVLQRLGADRGQVYRYWYGGFGAHLSERQLDLVRRVPGVLEVWQDTEGRPAPLARVPPAERVDGSYIISVADGVSPRAVAERTGVVPTGVYERTIHGFSANLTDAQLDLVRRDPDVLTVEDDAYSNGLRVAGLED